MFISRTRVGTVLNPRRAYEKDGTQIAPTTIAACYATDRMPTVPSVPLHNLQSYLDRIEALRLDAETDGFGTLAYLLDCAKLGAQSTVGTVGMVARDRADWKADPTLALGRSMTAS